MIPINLPHATHRIKHLFLLWSNLQMIVLYIFTCFLQFKVQSEHVWLAFQTIFLNMEISIEDFNNL